MRKFRVAVVGCGWASGVWLDYALTREDVEIKLLVDLLPESARRKREEKCLDCEIANKLYPEQLHRLEINLVFDTTIPDAHYGTVTDALRAGCDVFSEKPMSSDLMCAHKMVSAALETGRTYSVMQNYRYNKDIRAYKELIHDHVIGNLGTLHADFFLNPNFEGFRVEMESPLILDMAIHSFDAARFLSGADAISVYCHEYNPGWSHYKGDISAVAIFEMSNGSVFSYHGSWAAKGFNTSWNCDWRAIGSKGTAKWSDEMTPIAEVEKEGVLLKVEPSFSRKYDSVSHHVCLEEMIDSLVKGHPAETICTDNIKSMEMVFGAIESSRSGKKVCLS